MGIEIVIWKCEVFVERSPVGVFHVVSVGVHTKIRWGFTLSNVLSFWAQDTMPQVDYISATAVQAVQDLQRFPSDVTGKCFRGAYVLAAQVLC